MKVIGYTVGTTLPKPNMAQTDPTQGDYVKNKDALDDRYYTEEEIDGKLSVIESEIDNTNSVISTRVESLESFHADFVAVSEEDIRSLFA